MIDRKLKFHSLAGAVREAERLAAIETLEPGAVWTIPQTLLHCSQSIEYSLAGFPELKAALFQKTIGAAAFRIFSWRGHMSHDLAAPIPGAPPLDPESEILAAIARLHTAVQSFESASGVLRPHFAYGKLAKPDYEIAHRMHLASHLSAIDA